VKIEHMEKTWRSVEETGAFVATTFIVKWWWPGIPARTVGLYCPYGPRFPRYGWLLPLLNLLQQLPRMVLRTTVNLLDQEDRF